MSVITGENLIPPLFSKSFGDNLYSYNFASPAVVPIPNVQTYSLGTLPAGNYIVCVNLVVTQSSALAVLEPVFKLGNSPQFFPTFNTFLNLNSSPAFYGTTQTYSYVYMVKTTSATTFSIDVQNGGSGVVTLLPSSSGTFFQALQTSEN